MLKYCDSSFMCVYILVFLFFFTVWLQKVWVLLLCLQLCSASSTGRLGNTPIKPYVPVIPPHPITEYQAPKLLSPPHSPYAPLRQAKPAHLPHMTPPPSQTICSSCQKGERHLTSSEDTTKHTKDIKHTHCLLLWISGLYLQTERLIVFKTCWLLCQLKV